MGNAGLRRDEAVAIQAVIFDMDGVIVDSEPYSMQALIDILRQYGVEPRAEELRRSYGRRVRDDFIDYFSRYGVTAEVTLAIAHKHARYFHLAAGQLRAFPGVLSLLKRLHDQGYHLALASSGDRVKVAFGMQALRLNGTFEVIVSGDDVSHSKPDPEIYLTAARRLGVSPADCLAIEDAPAGVEAAKRAGMRCLAVTNSVAREQLQSADFIVDSLAGDLSSVLPL
jgi:HAD superfamily hydrolase (TIGR01509 family)